MEGLGVEMSGERAGAQSSGGLGVEMSWGELTPRASERLGARYKKEIHIPKRIL